MLIDMDTAVNLELVSNASVLETVGFTTLAYRLLAGNKQEIETVSLWAIKLLPHTHGSETRIHDFCSFFVSGLLHSRDEGELLRCRSRRTYLAQYLSRPSILVRLL
jgi:hypothetical protein